MSNRWDDFDCSLATSLSELPPPEETIREVTPFRSAMGKAIWGLSLTSFTLEIWYLSYLLPALGAILMVLGFRSLRNNNRWFQFCWILSIYQAIYLYSTDVLSATPLTAETAHISLWIPGIATVGAAALRYFCLWKGLAQAAAEVGQPRRAAAPALWALGWYGALILLGVLWPQPGWVIGLIMIIAFVRIVRSLLRLSQSLGSWGYSVRAAPVRIGGGRLAAAYLLSLAALVGALSVASNHLPVESQEVEQTSSSAETTAIRENLTALGFPEDLLSRLPEEEISRMEGAFACLVDWSDEEHWIGTKACNELIRFDTVYVQTGPHTLRIYEFFTFKKDTLRSNFQTITLLEPPSSAQISDVTGAISWTRDGAPYRSQLEISSQEYSSMFFGTSSNLPAALFSYPFLSQDRAGYMAYTSREPDDRITCSILRAFLTSYGHLYPYEPLAANSFRTDWYAQSYSTYDFVS